MSNQTNDFWAGVITAIIIAATVVGGSLVWFFGTLWAYNMTLPVLFGAPYLDGYQWLAVNLGIGFIIWIIKLVANAIRGK